MKTIFYLTILSAAAIGAVLFSTPSVAVRAASIGPNFSHDDCDKKRGRDREKCLERKNRSNSNSNANANTNSNSTGNSNSAGGSNSNASDRGSVQGISLSEARRIALQRVPGSVLKEEREHEHGRSVYEFYIRDGDGEKFEVYVDAANGEIVKVEQKRRDR